MARPGLSQPVHPGLGGGPHTARKSVPAPGVATPACPRWRRRETTSSSSTSSSSAPGASTWPRCSRPGCLPRRRALRSGRDRPPGTRPGRSPHRRGPVARGNRPDPHVRALRFRGRHDERGPQRGRSIEEIARSPACGRYASWSASTWDAAAASSALSSCTAMPPWLGRHAGSWWPSTARRAATSGARRRQ